MEYAKFKPEQAENLHIETDTPLEIMADQPASTQQESSLGRYDFFLQNIPSEIKDTLITEKGQKNTSFLEAAIQEIANNPALAAQYQDILINNNNEALKEKSSEQLVALLAQYYEGADEQDKEVLRKRLEEFQSAITALHPSRGDKASISFAEFQSPRLTKKVASYGERDIIAQADNYVYASLSELRHYMTEHSGQKYQLSESDAMQRGQIIMQDIANANEPTGLVKRYLNNLFDYKTGKEILAVYLASVFKTPTEAFTFVNKNNHPNTVQHWQKANMLYYPTELLPNLEQPITTLDKEAKIKESEIAERMRKIYNTLGIEPPLSLEVRIRDSAKIEG